MQREITQVTRLKLMRYIGSESNWEPALALASRAGELFVDTATGLVITFENVRAAGEFARQNDATVEWEGPNDATVERVGSV